MIHIPKIPMCKGNKLKNPVWLWLDCHLTRPIKNMAALHMFKCTLSYPLVLKVLSVNVLSLW